ncbi:MAG TPA: hypothetical protein VMF07_08755 [Solirubrobacteraceae bacterium]|nr:hypothetical protein [Solirubrobacteraceae bacterium]
MDGVARLTADRLPKRSPHRQPVRAISLRHERTLKWLVVDRAPDLHEAARTEKLSHIVHHNARPGPWILALLKLGIEFSQHAAECLTTK